MASDPLPKTDNVMPPAPTPLPATASGVSVTPSTSAFEQDLLNYPTDPSLAPVVLLKRIGRINTYEVMEVDLEDLDRATSSENQALAFTSLSAGAFVSTVVTWISLSAISPLQLAAYISATLVLGLASLQFGLSWRRERRTRVGLIRRIRSQTVTVRNERQ